MKAFNICQGYQLHQVAIAGLVFAVENHVVVVTFAFGNPWVGGFVVALAVGNVGFATDNRVYALRTTGIVKVDGAEQVAVVGQGDMFHA